MYFANKKTDEHLMKHMHFFFFFLVPFNRVLCLSEKCEYLLPGCIFLWL